MDDAQDAFLHFPWCHLVVTLKSSETEARCWRLGTFWYESQTDCHLNQDLLLRQWHCILLWRLFMPFLPKEICSKLMQHNVEAILLRPPFHLWRGDALCPSGSSHTDSKCERSPNCASGSYHCDCYSLLAQWDMRRAGGGNPTLEDILWRVLKNIKDVFLV